MSSSPAPTITLSDYRSSVTFHVERRANRRYPITLDVEYKVPGGNGVLRKGFGRTINISSRGALLYISDTLPNRCPILLSINWPFLLNGAIPLKLVMYGKVVRAAPYAIAVEVIQHAFHTARPQRNNHRQH